MAGDDVLGGIGQFVERAIGVEHVAEIERQREAATLLEMLVVMAGV